MLLWAAFGEQWTLNHKVDFDGLNKLIKIAPGVSSLNVKTEIYSDWKEWVQLYDNSKFPPAIRTTGGDPIGGGAFTGDTYFLINGWRLQISHSCTIDGVIFSDDYPSPFIQTSGTQIVTNKVSSLVSVIAPTVSVDGLTVPTATEIRQEIDNNSIKIQAIKAKTDTLVNGPTAVEIRQEMDANSTNLDAIQTQITNIPTAIRTELTPELARIDANISSIQGGLSTNQANMLLEMYVLLGLDPTKPLVVTTSSRSAGTINQTIIASTNETIVTRNP